MVRLLIVLLAFAMASPALAKDCTQDVLAAFQKQRASKAFRVEFDQATQGGVAHMRVDYVPPDKMMQTVTSPALPGEQQTMLVGNRAYAGSNGSFEELLPQFTQSIVAEVRTALAVSKDNIGTFECLGPAKFDNRDFVAYRTKETYPPGTEPAKMLARTLYVDPESGLPAFNVVASISGDSKPLMTVVYSYPDNVEIIAPKNAPVQKLH